jgi:hypothetical protein
MKKLFFGIITLLLSGTVLLAQPVSDNAVIPVSVTLNSILRLNIVSGGNIEFAVNTLQQYTDGIGNTTGYDTKFTVASSVDFNVLMYAEAATMVGGDLTAGSNTLPVGNVCYMMEVTGTALPANLLVIGDGDADGISDVVEPLNNTATTKIVDDIGVSAGDIEKNAFTIHWELATVECQAESSLSTLLSQGKPADRYSVNVFLELDPD